LKFLSAIIDLIFPPRPVCPLCGVFEGRDRICSACLRKLAAYQNEPVCSRCGRFFREGAAIKTITAGTGILCRDCLAGRRFFYLARAAGAYEGDLQKAVRRLKFSGYKKLAGHLSEIMFQTILKNHYYIHADLIAAVPLSAGRLRQRGFNQAELLACGLAEKMALPVLPVLRKVRETPPQTSLNRAGREKNLLGAFELAGPSGVRGKTVLLVDDVITTGTTLNIISGVLVNGGASSVFCIAAAAGRTEA